MKQVKKQLWMLGVSAMALCLSAPSVYAGQAASNITVSAAVLATCSISTANLNFGNYDPVTANATTALDVNGSVTVACTKGSLTWIDLNLGANGASALGTTRAMAAGGGNFLSYELYKDSPGGTVWGVGNPGNAFVPPGAVNKNARVFTIFGRIPAGQDSSVGNYTDTITATVNF